MSVVASEPRLFRTGPFTTAESPWWDPEGELVFVDIQGRRVIRAPLTGEVGGSDDWVFETPSDVGFVLPTWDGRLVLGLRDGVWLCDRDGDRLEPLTPIRHAAPGMRLNDAGIDPRGRLWAGSQNERDEKPTATFTRIDVSGDASIARDGMRVCNGPVWSLEGDRIFFCDTPTGKLIVADYTEAGEAVHERVLREGPHDGMRLDAEGCIWSGLWGEGAVIRMDTHGTELERVELPVPNVTCAAFGGAGLQTLFITTAAADTDRTRFPDAGAVFAVEVDVPGLPQRVFGSETPLGPGA